MSATCTVTAARRLADLSRCTSCLYPSESVHWEHCVAFEPGSLGPSAPVAAHSDSAVGSRSYCKRKGLKHRAVTHFQSAIWTWRVATERLSAKLPRASWIGPEEQGCCVLTKKKYCFRFWPCTGIPGSDKSRLGVAVVTVTSWYN